MTSYVDPQDSGSKLSATSSTVASKTTKVSLRLDSVFLEDREVLGAATSNYIPAGSISSHRDSVSDSEDERPHLHQEVASVSIVSQEDSVSFQPTTDNVIVFEVYTPTSQDPASDQPSRRKFSFPEDIEKSTDLRNCYVISEEQEVSISHESEEDKPQKVKKFGAKESAMDVRRDSSSDVLESGKSGYSGDEDSVGYEDFGPRASKSSLISELLKLNQLVHKQKGEIKGLKLLLSERDLALSQVHRGPPDRKERSTMTSPMEELRVIPALSRELEHLTSACKRYERQNQDLRREIQSCTSDLMQLDKAKGKLTRDFKKATQSADAYEAELIKISEFVDKVLQRPDDELIWSETDKNPKHLSNYVSSKIEIIGSRHSRLQAAYDRLTEENARLKQELEIRVKHTQHQAIDHLDMVKQLNNRIKLKDRFIQKLEKTLSVYKEKLVELRDDDLRRSLDMEQLSLMRPKNLTENFSNRLKDLAKLEKPFRSNSGSPSRDPDPAAEQLTPPPESEEGLLSFDLIKTPLKPHTLPNISEKPFVESDEEVYHPRYVSGSESLNNTLDVVAHKPETPVQVKRYAWKAKQSRRNLHFRTQSHMQNLFALENYKPVLMSRDTTKEPSFRFGRMGDDTKSKGTALTPNRPNTSPRLEKPTSVVQITPKVTKIPTEVHAKSTSLDRKKVSKETEIKAETKSKGKLAARSSVPNANRPKT